MKRQIYIIISALIFTTLLGCDDAWNEHYNNSPETINQSVWDALKNESNASKFVAIMEEFELDSIFNEGYNDVYTLFVPTNEAVDQYSAEHEFTSDDIAYHILRYFIQPNNIVGQRKIQTYLLKFAQFENSNNQLLYDNIPISFTSPLYENGRYFTIDQVASPKPSIYEYISENIPALKQFIDDQDSIILDKELSTAIGFDENGNTVYDSVITVINLFEEEFFEVTEEFRLKTATLVFPKKDLYENALSEMALKIGSGYTTHEDIAEEWQQEVLIPFLIEKGVYENQLEEVEFIKDSMINILGEYATIDFRPVDKTICSNGYAYNYSRFEILDSLFLSPLRTEGEALLISSGKDNFNWLEKGITVVSDEVFIPNGDYVESASNDSILKVNFSSNYSGAYSVEFNTEPLFPRRYLFVVRTHMDYGGIYDIYVNDVLVRTFDWYDFTRYRGVLQSSVPGVRFVADGRYNKFDFWVDNITEYGKARVRFEYKGPGQVRNHGLVLDYIECVNEEMLDGITKNP